MAGAADACAEFNSTANQNTGRRRRPAVQAGVEYVFGAL